MEFFTPSDGAMFLAMFFPSKLLCSHQSSATSIGPPTHWSGWTLWVKHQRVMIIVFSQVSKGSILVIGCFWFLLTLWWGGWGWGDWGLRRGSQFPFLSLLAIYPCQKETPCTENLRAVGKTSRPLDLRMLRFPLCLDRLARSPTSRYPWRRGVTDWRRHPVLIW